MFSFFSKNKKPRKLWFNTDIHCHVLPGIDDGSPDVDTSVELVKRMKDFGLERIIASPHVTQLTFENSRETLQPAYESLKERLESENVNIDLSYAAENRMDELFSRNLENNNLISYPNDWLLVENAFIQEPWNIDQLIFDLQVRGYRPILAHPERYQYYSGRRDRYRRLHDAGAAFQINVLSLAGVYGKGEKQVAEWLIAHKMVDFCGTDLHNHKHADAIEAYLGSKDAVRHAKALSEVIKNDTAFTVKK
ncbi:MAG: hypothetical protein K2M79_02520 [Muribaculaceae bacterium]|nr:hypothetical protein [Muribaculaceae bacterium]